MKISSLFSPLWFYGCIEYTWRISVVKLMKNTFGLMENPLQIDGLFFFLWNLLHSFFYPSIFFLVLES